MVRGMEVFGGMLILRRITAANMPALEAKAQVYPCITGFQAVLTPIRTGRDLPDMVKVCALCSQYMLLPG